MRFALFCLVLPALSIPAIAQSVQNSLPLEQTENDVTLRVTKAGFFDTTEKFEGFTAWGAPESGRSGFSIYYQLENAKSQNVKTPDGSGGSYREMGARANATTARLYAPSGELLKPCAGASNADGQQQVKWVSVNPSWDHVTLEVLALDPAAPLEAAGRFSETLAFKDVPLPRHFDNAVPVGSILRTAHGTAITLNSVTMQAVREGYPQVALEFDFNWEPPRSAPYLELERELGSVLDAQGKPHLSINGGGFFSQGSHFSCRLILASAPPPGDLSVMLHTREHTDALRQKQHYRRFRCDLKLPDATNLTATSDFPAQIAQSGKVVAALEKARWQGESSRLATWLWLRGRNDTPASGTAREWFITNLAARDQDGRKLEATWFENIQSDENHLAWRSDGVPAAPGERSQFFRIEWGETRPRVLSLEAKVEERLHRHRVAEFVEVPIPAPGKTQEVNAVVAATLAGDVPGAQIVLRRISRIEDAKLASFFPGWPRLNVPAGSLALLFEVGPALAQSHMDLHALLGDDEAGIPLHDENRIDVQEGDVIGSYKGKGWLRTVLLPPSAPGAKSLRVQVVVDETKATGQEATLIFPDVPMPVSPD